MDLIKISDSKLKIMLSSSDMAYYDLHNDSISFADVHARRVLRRLLADAREQTGFDGDMTRLYVQMYPSADGGCELFISKPEEDGEGEAAYPLLPCPATPTPYTKGRALRASEKRGRDMCAYSFERLKDLIMVCKRLQQTKFSGKSSLYTDQKRIYYLFLRDFPTPSLYTPDEYCFLGEYGTRENAKLLQNYICEYGRLICADNAVATMADL